jgi:hypothetical protein
MIQAGYQKHYLPNDHRELLRERSDRPTYTLRRGTAAAWTRTYSLRSTR